MRHIRAPYSFAALWLIVALVVVAGCDDPSRITSPTTAPRFTISDGSSDGQSGFYFLPPLVAVPSYSGTFDGTRAPTVRICALNEGACGAVVVSFTGPDVKVNLDIEAYQATWRTKGVTLNPAVTYRIEVYDGELLLGYADLLVLAPGTKSKDVDNSQYITVKQGGVLLIQFRIEQAGPDQAVFAKISVGNQHACGLTSEGVAYCWGVGFFGQLGRSDIVASPIPVEVDPTSGLRFVAISAGASHTCALTAEGRAYCWGKNDFSQLGDGTDTNRSTPVEVAPGLVLRFTSISGGTSHTCAVGTGERQIYCWGDDEWGQLGRGAQSEFVTIAVPTAIDAQPGWDMVAAGHDHTCALSDNFAYCWGSNGHGQLGDPSRGELDPKVALIPGNLYTTLSTGFFTTCAAVRDADVVECWGPGNAYAQRVFPEGAGITAVTVEWKHACAITGDNVAYCWGENLKGQLGNGTTDNSADPVAVGPGAGLLFSAIDAAIAEYTCGLTTDGRVWCWGFNQGGQLGNGTYTDSPVPTPVLAP